MATDAFLFAPHISEPNPTCDDVHHKTVEVGEASEMLPAPLVEAKNAVRSTYATLTHHYAFGDNRTWQDISDTLSDGPYYISADSLKLANEKAPFTRKDAEGNVEDSLDVGRLEGKELCVTLYRPAYGGEKPVEGDMTLMSMAKEMNKKDAPEVTLRKTVDQLKMWNPELAKTDEDALLQKGTILQIESKVNKNLVYRQMKKADKSLGAIKVQFKSLSDDIDSANHFLKSIGSSPDKPGAFGYLPYIAQKPGKGESIISLPQIQVGFTMDGRPVNVALPKKPETPNKPTPSRPGNEVDNKPPRINPMEGSISKAKDIPPAIKAAMLRQYKNSEYIQAAVLAGQIKTESNFKIHDKSSAGADGPAQFTPSTWQGAGRDGNHDGKKDMHNPDDAFAAQVDYMDKMYVWAANQKEKGNLRGDTLELALQAYNRGQGKVLALGHVATRADFDAGRVPTMETVNYPIRVKNYAKRYGYKG